MHNCRRDRNDGSGARSNGSSEGANDTKLPPVDSGRLKSRIRRRASFDFGLRAEAMVGQFLRSGGYEIVARRARIGSAEIDLIARRGKVFAFVEVKARRRGIDGYYSVDKRKQARISTAAEIWLAERPFPSSDVVIRFDTALVWPGGALDYVENAFDAVPGDDDFVW